MNGFFFANPSGLWALGILPAVVAMYLFYRRYRPVLVTGLFLWGEHGRDGKGGRQVETPRFGRSFWLDMAAALFFALTLAEPSWRNAALPLVVVLDDSYAMRARDAHVEAVRQAMLHADGRREAAVIAAGTRPRLLLDLGKADAGRMRAALDEYLPSAEAADLPAGVALARDLYGSEIEVRLWTNRDDYRIGQEVGGREVVHVLPGRGNNPAFGNIWRLVEPDRPGWERVILSLAHYGDSPATVTLTIRTAAREFPRMFFEETLRLNAGETANREILLSAVGSETLAVMLTSDGEDVIADDSLAFLPPAPRRKASFAVSGLGEEATRFFRLGLTAAGCRPAEADAVPDLLVTGDAGRTGGVLTLQITPPDGPGVVMPPYLVDAATPLCRDLDLSGTAWVAASPTPDADVRDVYVAAGSFPLYWRSEARRLHMNLVVEQSPLPHDPAWPVLLANLAARTADALPGLGRTLYAPGEVLRFVQEPGSPPASLCLLSETGKAAAYPPGRGVALPREAGMYRLSAEGTDIGEVAVAPLYGRASDTSRLAGKARTAQTGRAAERNGGGTFPLTLLPLVLAMSALAVNWRKEATCP